MNNGSSNNDKNERKRPNFPSKVVPPSIAKFLSPDLVQRIEALPEDSPKRREFADRFEWLLKRDYKIWEIEENLSRMVKFIDEHVFRMKRMGAEWYANCIQRELLDMQTIRYISPVPPSIGKFLSPALVQQIAELPPNSMNFIVNEYFERLSAIIPDPLDCWIRSMEAQLVEMLDGNNKYGGKLTGRGNKCMELVAKCIEEAEAMGITNFTSEFRGWFHDHHRAYEKEASKKLEELLAGLVVINEHFTGWKERHQNDHQDDF